MLSFFRPIFLVFLLLRFTTAWVIRTVTTMSPVLVENAFWISFTINMSTMFFFVCRGCVTGVTRRFCDRPNDYRRALYVLHDNKKWYCPRFIVTTIQSVVLSLLGVVLLCQGTVLDNPFYGLDQLSRICFAINIGCYIYRIVQDVILQRDLNKVSVDIVHHFVTVVVYIVFLSYEQNLLFGALGMLFAVTTPCIEIRRLIKAADLEHYVRVYRTNLLVCCILTLLVRLLIPIALIIWSLVHGSPLTMDVVVVAIYFLSVIFFGILNIWLAITSVTSIYKCWYKQRTDKLQRVLNAGEPHGLEIQASDRSKYTTRKNYMNYMMPCSNANIAPQLELPTNAQRYNLPGKSYQKANMIELFGTPTQAAAFSSYDNRRRESSSRGSSSSDGLIQGATETNVNVQINDFERSSLSWDDSSSRVSLPLPTVSNLDRSRESSSTTSDVETLHGYGRSDLGQVDECAACDECLPATETDHLFLQRKPSGERGGSAVVFPTTRTNRIPLTRTWSGGALDQNSNHIYSMQMAIMREHDVNLPNNSSVGAIRHNDVESRDVSINQSQSPSPRSSRCSDVSDDRRARSFNSA
ncbi:uncharacterized protein [Amphiura filiformis]|uniref:uncharacterized protein n=1 Tax=Amphiura filiformis TaxID=82378 RepID=UPI003B20DECF